MRPSSMAALSSKPTSCLTYQAHQIQLLHPIKADRSCQIFLQLDISACENLYACYAQNISYVCFLDAQQTDNLNQWS